MGLVALTATALWVLGGENDNSALSVPTSVLQLVTAVLATGLYFSFHRHQLAARRRVILAAFVTYGVFVFCKLGSNAGYQEFDLWRNITLVGFAVLLITAGTMILIHKLRRTK